MSPLTIRSIRTAGVEVPMRHVLGTSQTAVRAAPLLLVDVETEQGITGHAYLFAYVKAALPAIASMMVEIEAVVKGERASPVDLWAKLARRFALLGVQGIVRMAMSAFDIACWDALAIAADEPLARLLGGAPRPIPAYNSNGLGLMPLPALADEAQALLEGGWKALKLRLGYPSLEEDLAALRTVRQSVPEDAVIMVDYNQALSVEEAIRRGRALDAESVYWIEEPIRHADYRGCARVATEISTPIQLGENFSLPSDMEQALAERASDFVMPDVERIGGVTGWQRAAALAAASGIPMSSHLAPEVSAHLLAVTPTCHWLEYVDWANPLLQEALRVENGNVFIADRPGNGLAWDAGALAKYRI